jgi:hypothetical protein
LAMNDKRAGQDHGFSFASVLPLLTSAFLC